MEEPSGSDLDADVEAEGGVEIPREALPPEVLRALVEEFVTRDGTDYGAVERDLESKVADVMRQFDRGEVRIVFDPESETATLIRSDEVIS